MSSEEVNKRLKQLNIEDFIWLIYIGIIILSWYANTFERKYFIYNDRQSKEKYRKLTMLIFTILIVVYTYFLKDSFQEIKSLKPYDNKRKKSLTYFSFLGSLLIAISGAIFLVIAILDTDIDIEIAFN
ncbi:MAG: hypothetical protein ACI4PE_00220 [Bacilli bacterium]